jgi:hypothetical protein
MIQPSEARELCSESELALVEGSFSPTVETLAPSDLKSMMGRVRKLQQKSTDLVDRQHSDARKLTTRRKTQLFAEAVRRFEAALAFLEKAHRVAPVSENENGPTPAEAEALNRIALQERADHELESRKTHALSAMAVRAEQQGAKSGSRRIQSHVGSVTRRQQARRDSKNS